ncbi:MAG: gliding motility-associated C-terminal domain-containing protein [Ginsengibacter sp.]
MSIAVKTFFLFFICCCFIQTGNGQTCSTLGQTPSTAFPVCGTSVFSQTTVPYCGGRSVPGPCSATDSLTDTNPFWYKFTCFKEGTLGFLITPVDLSDDYDWQLFDVTGHDPNEIYTNPGLFVSCNWSGNTGLTGASSAGQKLNNCAGPKYPTFSSMPTLKLNHNYLLLVSHFTKYKPGQDGYQLSFGGGTASITDTIPPALQSLSSSCDASNIFIKTNKKMKCNSLAGDGSDFEIYPAVAKVISAQSFCDAFDMDSLVLKLDHPLPAGDYTIRVKQGSDANTLVDNCGTNIPVGNSLPLKIVPLAPTPMDSLTSPSCAPQALQLVFKKNISCNSISTDGSDFQVQGPSPVQVVSANGACKNGMTKIITVNLSGPIVNGGLYKIILKEGNDGNTLIDECAQQTPAGSSLNFLIKDTVSAAFSYSIKKGCNYDTVYFNHPGGNQINTWFWQLDYNGTSSLQNPVSYFDSFGKKQIILKVSNGFCSDTVRKEIILDNELKASFETNNILCPEDSAIFKNTSVGNIVSYLWNFQNGNISENKVPGPQKYPILLAEHNYAVSLIVQNDLGCYDTAINNIRALKSCYIAVPNAFTPNGDGLNDYLYPLNAYKADNLTFRVYNRTGQLLFETHDWTRKWDGTFKGEPQDAGVFVWTLKYILRDTGKPVFTKGSATLIR